MRTFNLQTLKSLVLSVYACEFPTAELVNLVNFWVKLVKLGWIDLLLVKKLHSQKRSFQSLRANYIHFNKLTFIFLFKYYWAVFLHEKVNSYNKTKVKWGLWLFMYLWKREGLGRFRIPVADQKHRGVCEREWLSPPTLPSPSLLHL